MNYGNDVLYELGKSIAKDHDFIVDNVIGKECEKKAAVIEEIIKRLEAKELLESVKTHRDKKK